MSLGLTDQSAMSIMAIQLDELLQSDALLKGTFLKFGSTICIDATSNFMPGFSLTVGFFSFDTMNLMFVFPVVFADFAIIDVLNVN
jgi:hypothetical protein